jgi:MFS family permease
MAGTAASRPATRTRRSPWPPALRYPLFARLWAGSVASSIGTQMNNTAKLWVLYALTHSSTALGIDGLCFSAPIVILPLVAGPICDRVDRRAIVVASMTVEAVEAAALAIAATAGVLRPWIIYLAAAVEAARLAFDIPARTALTTTLVPSEALFSAQALSAAVWNSAALAGPALGGLLLATAGATAVFAANSITTLAALASFLPVRHANLPPAADGGRRTGLSGGLRHAFTHRELVTLQAILLGVSTIALGTETLLPILDHVLWHGGPAGYGMLRAAPGIAAVLTGIGAASWRSPRHQLRAASLIMTGACALLITFTLAPVLAAGVILLALASVAVSICQILAATRIQQVTPGHLRGAISGLNAITQSGLAGIAAAAMALTAASLGARTVIIAVAALTATTGLIAPLGARRARRHDHSTHGGPAATGAASDPAPPLHVGSHAVSLPRDRAGRRGRTTIRHNTAFCAPAAWTGSKNTEARIRQGVQMALGSPSLNSSGGLGLGRAWSRRTRTAVQAAAAASSTSSAAAFSPARPISSGRLIPAPARSWRRRAMPAQEDLRDCNAVPPISAKLASGWTSTTRCGVCRTHRSTCRTLACKAKA